MAERHHVLVIDDDRDFHEVINFILEPHGILTTCLTSWEDASQSECAPEAILLDRMLGKQDGLDHLPAIRSRFPRIPIVLITADNSTDLIVQSIKLGAFDFVGKPLDEGRLLATLTKAFEHKLLKDQVESLSVLDKDDSFEGMIGRSGAMQTVFRTICHVAPTDVSVMVSGESGTGKELVARAVHNRSHRKDKPFVALNMAGLPKELVESTLFGHEKGAFTGADKRHIGLCEEAQGGTLFLDEITEMPLELQPKLLRFLQEKTIRRVGGSSDIRLNVRVVAATNRDPMAEVDSGRFRLDLYYRLNVVPIALPPLRERHEDISLLTSRFLSNLGRKHKKKFKRIDDRAKELLRSYSWPGNVRQLFHLVERLVVLNEGPDLLESMLPAEISQRSPDRQTIQQEPTPVPAPVEPTSASEQVHDWDSPTSSEEVVPLAELEKRAITDALKACNGSASMAARRLGISTATIYRRIKSLGLDAEAM